MCVLGMCWIDAWARPDWLQRHYVLYLSVRASVHLFVCYQTCEHDIWKWINQFWCKLARAAHGQVHKTVTLGGQGSKVKVTRGQNRSKKSLLVRYINNCPTNFNQTSQKHITVNVSVSAVGYNRSKVKGQGHTRPKILAEAWFSTHLCRMAFLVLIRVC